MIKYVFIQDDPFYLPDVLDKYLREFADSTVGVDVQTVAQGKRSVLETARELYQLYGFVHFQWKLRGYLWRKAKALLINDWLRSTRRCYSVSAVARRYGVAVTRATSINGDEFRQLLRDRGVELIVSISGTQFCGKKLRDQTPGGIINCHGALLPRYRGLLPSFWTLANEEKWGGSTVHFVNERIDDGPIVVQNRYRIWPHDSLEDVTARSKDLAAETILQAVRLIESGEWRPIENDRSQATQFTLPTREDMKRFLATGHRLR